MFGAASRILEPPQPSTVPLRSAIPPPHLHPPTQIADKSKPSTFPWDPGESDIEEDKGYESIFVIQDQRAPRKPGLLTDLLPDPGYFVAGGVAGVVSRTATAPLDRLKVYLIAQVGVRDVAVQAAKTGAPVKVAKSAARPLIEAIRTLWRMGGIRSLFAGKKLSYS